LTARLDIPVDVFFAALFDRCFGIGAHDPIRIDRGDGSRLILKASYEVWACADRLKPVTTAEGQSSISAKGSIMNLVNRNDTARTWSERLGNLAAESQPIRPQADVSQIGTQSTAVSPHLSALLQQLHRNRRQEQAADKLRVHEFLAGT
jgi:hypothetical protein